MASIKIQWLLLLVDAKVGVFCAAKVRLENQRFLNLCVLPSLRRDCQGEVGDAQIARKFLIGYILIYSQIIEDSHGTCYDGPSSFFRFFAGSFAFPNLQVGFWTSIIRRVQQYHPICKTIRGVQRYHPICIQGQHAVCQGSWYCNGRRRAWRHESGRNDGKIHGPGKIPVSRFMGVGVKVPYVSTRFWWICSKINKLDI